MALDERQQQIKEGAGLEESRLNVEFIDWLRKWSTPLLVVVALLVLAYVGYERWQLAKRAEVDRAFVQLDSITESPNPSPESLKSIADEFEGVRAVSPIARLAAADIYLQAARRGVKVGANMTSAGAPAEATDLLNDEQRAAVLADAESLYARVFAEAVDRRGWEEHAIGAAYGLAAVAECRGDAATAGAHYGRVVDLAEAAGLAAHAETARKRLASLPSLKMPRLYAAAELPKLPWADELNPPPIPDALPGDGGPLLEATPVDPAAAPPAEPDPAAPQSQPPPAGEPGAEPPKADPPPPSATPPPPPPK